MKNQPTDTCNCLWPLLYYVCIVVHSSAQYSPQQPIVHLACVYITLYNAQSCSLALDQSLSFSQKSHNLWSSTTPRFRTVGQPACDVQFPTVHGISIWHLLYHRCFDILTHLVLQPPYLCLMPAVP